MKYTFNINKYLVEQRKAYNDLKHSDDYKKLVNSTLEDYSWQKRSHGKEVLFTAGYNVGYLVIDGAIMIIKREWCSVSKESD